MTNIKAVLIDVDGCVTDGKGYNINPECYKIGTFAKLVPMALCTGRSQPYAEAILQILGLTNFGFPSIVENGCFLYAPNRDELIINPKISDLGEDVFSLKDEIRRYFVASGHAKMECGKEICISLNPTHSSIECLRDKVELFVSANFSRVASVTSSQSAVDITPLGIDKSSGVEHLKTFSKVDPKFILGIGDSGGDLPMLRELGFIACPSNATNEVKSLVLSRGGYVSRKPSTKGVLDILRCLL